MVRAIFLLLLLLLGNGMYPTTAEPTALIPPLLLTALTLSDGSYY